MKYYLAIDIGASSGRHIVGWMEEDGIHTKEVFRFPNGNVERNGHLEWDIASLNQSIRKGIDEALLQFPKIESLSIDTWGVDYVLMNGDEEILPCYAYRDHRTDATIPQVHEIMPFAELYRRTGIQFQTFNTIYQLYDDKLTGRLDKATDWLMMPEYFLYKLCGTKAREYTEATTGGLLDAYTGEFDPEIISALGFPARLFPKLEKPGKVLGEYKGIRCVLCATHDTASAVEGIPMEGNELFISSGTWSLLGVKNEVPITNEKSFAINFTNEGGVGYIRYLKNIMGLWLVQSLQKELCPEKSFADIALEAEADSFDGLVDANAQEFLSPVSMKEAFDNALSVKPDTVAGYFRCAYRSLALCYKQAISDLQSCTGKTYSSLYIVGGGAKNGFLNKLTAEATGLNVIALPIEGTAIGNLLVQMKYDVGN